MNPTDSIAFLCRRCGHSVFRRHEVQGASVIEPYVIRLFAASQKRAFVYLLG